MISKTKKFFFEAFFDFLNEKKVEYVVVGDSSTFPDEIASDVDIVMSNADFKGVEKLVVAYCSKYAMQLVQQIQHEHTAKYFVLSWFDVSGSPCFLHLDICSDYYRNGKLFMSAAEILASSSRHNSFRVPAPPQEFLYYLLKKVDKQQFALRSVRHLKAELMKDPDGASQAMERVWAASCVKAVLGYVYREDCDSLMALIPELRTGLHDKLSRSFVGTCNELLRKIRRVLFPTGVFIAVLGPDGAGKSTVMAEVVNDLAPAFRNTKQFHLFPGLRGGQGNGKIVTDPHSQPPRGYLGSVAKLCYLWVEYTMGYWLKVRPKLVHSTLVIFDRYYHDLLVDPVRYRYGGPLWLAALLGRTIPQPAIWIVFDATPETLQARKQEVPFEESARQVERYRIIARHLCRCSIVDASLPFESVVREVDRGILSYLSCRTPVMPKVVQR